MRILQVNGIEEKHIRYGFMAIVLYKLYGFNRRT